MLDNLVNPLPATSDYRFSARHRLEIHASQTFISAGQRKYRAAPHGFCHFCAALPGDELDLAFNVQAANQSFKSSPIRAFPDDAASNFGK